MTVIFSDYLFGGKTYQDRFQEGITYRVNGECWEWVGTKDKDGYGKTTYNKKYYRSHVLAYELYYGKQVKGTGNLVLHICHNPSCVRPVHLELGDHKENQRQKVESGRAAKGSSQGSVILTEEQVRDIRSMHKYEGYTYKELSDFFCVSESTIGKVVNRVTWNWV